MKKRILFLAIAIMVLISMNLSAQWEPPVILFSDSAVLMALNNSWGIASCADSLHIVWADSRVGWEIYYARSMDNGTTWDSDTNLSNSQEHSRRPAIAVENSSVHITWNDFSPSTNYWDIRYKRSTDGGITWEPDTVLLTYIGGSQYNTAKPSIAVSNGYIHIVSAKGQVHYARSGDNGASWEPDTVLSSGGDCQWPSIAVVDSLVHVVWQRNNSSNAEILYRRSTDYGATWENEIQITIDTVKSAAPSVAAWDSKVFVFWQNSYDNLYIKFNIFFARSLDGGETWQPESQLTNTTQSHIRPNAAVDGNNIHLIWQHWVDEYTLDARYICSEDNGSSWGSEHQIWHQCNLDPLDLDPTLCISDTALYVLFNAEALSSGEQIMFCRNLTGNSISEAPPSQTKPGLQLSIFPIPFSSITCIRIFEINEDTQTNLSIYDASGRLVESVEMKSNTYHLGADLVPGVYFLKLKAGDYTETHKLIKIR